MGKRVNVAEKMAVELLEARLEQLRRREQELIERAVEAKERFEEAEALLDQLADQNGTTDAAKVLKERMDKHASDNLGAVNEIRKVQARITEIEELLAILKGGDGRAAE